MASAGLISLGHSAFFGLGGYVAILLANLLGAPFWLSLLATLAAGALLGSALSFVTGRMRGIYFAITTLAVSEGLRVIAVMLPDLTGGAKGAYLAPENFPGATVVNLSMGAAAVGACLIAWLISRSRYHFAFRAMRANERASQMLGVYPLKYRTAITALSGALASLVGGIEIWHGGYIDPALAFDLHITITSQIAPILGGLYTLAGPVLGAIATVFLGDATRIALGHIQGASLLVFGLVLVGCVLYLPQGIRGALDQFLRRHSGGSGKSSVVARARAADVAQP
jgi:branched-chain amino acid transport system permease protein